MNEADRLLKVMRSDAAPVDANERRDWEAWRELTRLLEAETAGFSGVDAEALAAKVLRRSKPLGQVAVSNYWLTAAVLLFGFASAAYFLSDELQPEISQPQLIVQRSAHAEAMNNPEFAWDDDWEESARRIEVALERFPQTDPQPMDAARLVGADLDRLMADCSLGSL